MPLTSQRTQWIVNIDSNVTTLLANDVDKETLLAERLVFMPDIKTVMDVSTEKEIEWYIQAYDGFCRYMKLLERLAQGISDRSIPVPS